jgi:hypothetical protein
VDFFAAGLAVALPALLLELFVEVFSDLELEAFEDVAGAAGADCPTAGF